jgi:dTDP-4-dehydrorhamnose reductase
VNTFGTYNIAVGAKSCGAKLIYISTAGVFNGEKVDLYSDSDIDSAEPQNHYSKSKYLGEIAVKHLLKDYLIFRTGWLFGGGPKKDRKFVGKILNSILHEKKKVLSVVNDTKGTPTYCKDLIDIVKKSILSNVRGVFLLGNAGYATRHDMASFIVSVLHTRTQVKIVNSDIFQLDVRRISSEAFNTSPHFNTRSWKKALQEYINREWLYKND